MPSTMRVARFAAISLAVAAAMAALVAGLARYETFQMESFGDRRLDRPTADECAAARLILRQLTPQRPALLASVGAAGQPMELLAFAWNSPGPRVRPGADWRACSGFGPFVRGLGMARLNSGGRGPSLYISRLRLSPDRTRAAAWVTFYPPLAPDEGEFPKDRRPARVWDVEFARTPAGAWRLTRFAPTPGA